MSSLLMNLQPCWWGDFPPTQFPIQWLPQSGSFLSVAVFYRMSHYKYIHLAITISKINCILLILVVTCSLMLGPLHETSLHKTCNISRCAQLHVPTHASALQDQAFWFQSPSSDLITWEQYVASYMTCLFTVYTCVLYTESQNKFS